MDPFHEELQGISASQDPLEASLSWIGISSDLLVALRCSLGSFTLVRQLALMPRGAWEDGLQACVLEDRPLNALEMGQAGSTQNRSTNGRDASR